MVAARDRVFTDEDVKRFNKALGHTGASLKAGERLQELLEDRDSIESALSLLAAGAIAHNVIDASNNPTAGDRISIGGTTFQWLTVGGAGPNDVTNVCVVRESTADASWENLRKAVQGESGKRHSLLNIGDGETPALAKSFEHVRAAHDADANLFYIFAAASPGGDIVAGSAPNIACTDNLTASVSWRYENLNVSGSAGQRYAARAPIVVPVTTAMINAGTYAFFVGFYSADAKVIVHGRTAAGVPKASMTDAATLTEGPLPNIGLVTLTLEGGGSDLANTDQAWIEILSPTTEGISLPISDARVFQGRLDVAETEIDAAQAAVVELDARRSYLFTFTGAGDQADMSTAGTKTFTKKATVPASYAAVDDWVEWEAEVLVDGANSTPEYTVKLLWGTAELDSQVIATAAATDYVLIRGRGRITGATTCRMYKGLGETKDGTLSLHTHAAPADVTIQALTSARDITATIVSNAQHATNLATLKSLRFELKKAA